MRNRYRELDRVTGWYRVKSQLTGQTTTSTRSAISEEEWCDDVTGNFGGQNPLLIRKRTVIGSVFNGQRSSTASYENYPSDFLVNSALIPFSVDPEESNEMLVTRLLAATNPSRIDVNVPAFIGELRDFPMMIRHAGHLLLKLRNPRHSWRSYLSAAREAASANLAYQFGWAPLLSDLDAMFGFTKQVAKRQRELERLYSSAGLKRRLPLGERTVSSESPNFRLDFGYYTHNPVQNTATMKIWGSVRWKPTGTPPSNLSWLAAQTSYGLSADSIVPAVWELLPWSWLADYFGNVGHYLQATRNKIPAIPTAVCLMKQTTRTRSHGTELYNNGKLIVSPGYSVIIDKERFPQAGVPQIDFHMPFLSGNQMGILSSLMVAKYRPVRL